MQHQRRSNLQYSMWEPSPSHSVSSWSPYPMPSLLSQQSRGFLILCTSCPSTLCWARTMLCQDSFSTEMGHIFHFYRLRLCRDSAGLWLQSMGSRKSTDMEEEDLLRESGATTCCHPPGAGPQVYTHRALQSSKMQPEHRAAAASPHLHPDASSHYPILDLLGRHTAPIPFTSQQRWEAHSCVQPILSIFGSDLVSFSVSPVLSKDQESYHRAPRPPQWRWNWEHQSSSVSHSQQVNRCHLDLL